MSNPPFVVRGPTGGAPNRLEINDFVKDEKFFSLYVQALRAYLYLNLYHRGYTEYLLSQRLCKKKIKVELHRFSRSQAFMVGLTFLGTVFKVTDPGTQTLPGVGIALMDRFCSLPGTGRT